MELPLENVKVLDMSRMLPGPYCTRLLADMGAQVTRIEQPAEIKKFDQTFNIKSVDKKDRRRIRAYDIMGRNKKSVLIDLKKEESREIIYKLAENSDIFVQDYRPGVMEWMGFDYERIKKVNPKIIYCSISLCGQDGPYRRKPGHDPIAQALSGVLGRIVDKDNVPMFAGYIPIGDMTAGLNAVVGILLALRVKEQEGRGQHIDISMQDTVMDLLSRSYQEYFQTGVVAPHQNPRYRGLQGGIWETKDGKYIVTTDMEPKYWSSFCCALGREDFIPCQHDEGKKEEIIETIQNIMLTKTRDEWVELLSEKETQAAPVYDLDEAVRDPQALHRQMVHDVEDPVLGKIRQVGIPIKLSATPGKIKFVAPPPGKDTEDTMRDLGYSDEIVDELIKKGVIHTFY